MKKIILILLIFVIALALCACSDEASMEDAAENTADVSGVESPDNGQNENKGDGGGYAFGISHDDSLGNAYSDNKAGYYAAGTVITAHAAPAEGQMFTCWTTGGYYDDGGTVLSYDPEYTFTLSEDTQLYANFYEHTFAMVLYHVNGGRILKNEVELEAQNPEEEYWDFFSLAYFLYPNTLPDMGYFQRDGYNLIGYSTEPDGGGEFYNVGGKAFEDTDRVIELWCVWSKQTPDEEFIFEYDTAYGGFYISAYNGTDPDVSLPSTHEGMNVFGVATGAFSCCDTMETLVIPSNYAELQDYAFDECPNLQKLWIFDSLDYLSDNTFFNDKALSTVYFGAATDPVYCNWFNNHTKKVEIMRYWQHSERPKMIILGGSSTTYAVDAEQLESLLDKDYLVLNCGSNGANLFNMTSEWAMRFLNEGDFMLQIIEYSAWQLGGVICRWESWRSFESCYNVFSWVDATMYYSFFDAFHDFLDARKSQTPQYYEYYVSNLAPNGYYDIQGTLNVVTKANGSPTFWQGRRIRFRDYWAYDFMVYYCNRQYQRFRDMGVDIALAFTPLNKNSLYDDQTEQGIDDFTYYLDHVLDIPILGTLRESLVEPEILFDDDYHLAAPARAEYTERLAGYLNDYFANPESYENEIMPNGYTTEANIAAAAARAAEAAAAAEAEAAAEAADEG